MLPKYTTPDELAKHLGCSARRVRSFARSLGVARVLGNRVILLQEDIAAIMEATRCPSSSIGAVKSGTTEARLPEGSYEDLQRLRARKQPNELPLTKSSPPGKVISIQDRS
jgi:hypothetical protein